MSKEPQKKTSDAGRPAQDVQKSSMSVFLYILILFSAALLLMGLSSLIHQRNNTEALGQIQDSVSAMQEVQHLQENVIALQEARRTLEAQLEQTRSDQLKAAAQAEEARRRAEAMERLYLIQAQYEAGFYQSCQTSVEAFEADGLYDALPTDAPAEGVRSPLDRYRQLKEAVAARVAEILDAPSTPEG